MGDVLETLPNLALSKTIQALHNALDTATTHNNPERDHLDYLKPLKANPRLDLTNRFASSDSHIHDNCTLATHINLIIFNRIIIHSFIINPSIIISILGTTITITIINIIPDNSGDNSMVPNPRRGISGFI
jgi:hypothetical protein